MLTPSPHAEKRNLVIYLLFGGLVMLMHSADAYLFGEARADATFSAMIARVGDNEALYLALKGMIVLAFTSMGLAAFSNRSLLYVSLVPGVIFSHEIHHLIRCFIFETFYPGTISGVLVAIFSIFYWRSWWRYKKALTIAGP